MLHSREENRPRFCGKKAFAALMNRQPISLSLFLALIFFAGCECDDDKVHPVSTVGISLDKKEWTLSVGIPGSLVASFEPADATQQEVLWKSSNPAVATVDDNGQISTLQAGSATISATLKNGGYDVCFLEVTDPSIVDFNLKEAAHGAELHIQGKGFSAKELENSVTLNGVPAKLVFSTREMLKVEVQKDARCTGPERQCTGPVEVSVGGKTVAAGTPFTYLPTVIVSTLTTQIAHLSGIVMDEEGNFYVTAPLLHTVYKVSPQGASTLFVGRAEFEGPPDGNRRGPHGIAMGRDGNFYVADTINDRIRIFTKEGRVSTLQVQDSDGNDMVLQQPRGIAVDPRTGDLYVTTNEPGDNSIYKLTLEPGGQRASASLFVRGSDASFLEPRGMAMDKNGNLYVANYARSIIQKISQDGRAVTLAGRLGVHGFQDGTGSEAMFDGPSDIVVDADGNLYVTEFGNHLIRKLTPEGKVSTLAGDTTQAPIVRGSEDGPGSKAQFNNPQGLIIDARTGIFYVADYSNQRIRKIVFE